MHTQGTQRLRIHTTAAHLYPASPRRRDCWSLLSSRSRALEASERDSLIDSCDEYQGSHSKTGPQGSHSGTSPQGRPVVRAFAARTATPPPRLVFLGASLAILVLCGLARLMASIALGSHRGAAFAMSTGAGMATGIGAMLVLCTRSLDRRLLACTMSFSAGVMLYVSLVEVVAVSSEHFAKGSAPPVAYASATGAFFVGVGVMAVVDSLVHAVFHRIAGVSDPRTHSHSRDSHVAESLEGGGGGGGHARPRSAQGISAGDETARCLQQDYDPEAFEDESGASIRAIAQLEERSRLLMMAAVVSAAIVLHNIPEGMATYVASFHSVSAGAPLAIAIAIHNIPEGLAIAMPVYYATHSRSKAVGLGALSGMSEPFGAFLASLVANEDSSTGAFGFMFGLTGGMMAYVCIAELLPAAFLEKGVNQKLTAAAFFAGCAVMASSLVIEKFATAE